MAGLQALRRIIRALFVDHATGEYANDEVVGAIHTNTIEGFWSLLKRGIIGNYHKVTANIFRSTSRNFASGTTTARTLISSGKR